MEWVVRLQKQPDSPAREDTCLPLSPSPALARKSMTCTNKYQRKVVSSSSSSSSVSSGSVGLGVTSTCKL